ncbi:MFS transporter [Celerinatantimonas sp. MCCC 1A17872]|uniref:MFS transporter n=1 Tax=Celerinatantimonas sp. MCCC 1A17872 TaxID=3177514 RepID=UPI0038BE414E
MELNEKTPAGSYLVGRFFDGISSGLFMMALPWVMLSTPNMGVFVSLVALVCTVISFVLTPVLSTVIDRYSRKNILILVQLSQAATAAVVASVYGLGFSSNWLLAAAQLIFWVSGNVAWATNHAFTQENFYPHEYASISGKQEVTMQATTLGAGALGVALLQRWGMFEFSIFAAMASAMSVICYFFTPYRRQLRHSLSLSFIQLMTQSRIIFTRQPHFYLFLMLSALCYPILTFLEQLVPIWFSQTGISGGWFAAYNIAFALGSLITGVFISRLLTIGPYPLIMIAAMAFAAMMLVGMSLSTSLPLLMMFTFCFGFFNALNRIARVNLMHHSIHIDQRGRADGGLKMFSTFAQSISYVVIALLSHFGIAHFGFFIAAGVLVLSVLMMMRLHKRPNLVVSASS